MSVTDGKGVVDAPEACLLRLQRDHVVAVSIAKHQRLPMTASTS